MKDAIKTDAVDEIEIDGVLYNPEFLRERLIEASGALRSIPVDRMASVMRDRMWNAFKGAMGENLPPESAQYEIANNLHAMARDFIVQCCDAFVERGLESQICRMGDVKFSAKDGTVQTTLTLVTGDPMTFALAAGSSVKVSHAKPQDFFGESGEPEVAPDQSEMDLENEPESGADVDEPLGPNDTDP